MMRYDTCTLELERELFSPRADDVKYLSLDVLGIATVECDDDDDCAVWIELIGDPDRLWLRAENTARRYAFWKELRFMVLRFRSMQ
jgi:hypothetical protein